MTEQTRQMFLNNIELIDMTDKAVLAFREQNYLITPSIFYCINFAR